MKFSIIVPVYRAEKYLNQCINSILMQSYKDFELILIDDGSDDNSPAICDSFAQKCLNINVFHTSNHGAAQARNVGMSVSHGDYIMFADSDDYWDSNDALMSVAKLLDEFSCDVLCMNLKKFTDGTNKFERYFNVHCVVEGLNEIAKRQLYISSACCKVVHKSLVHNHALDFISGITSEDIDWCLRLAISSSKMVYADLDFYCYRQHNASVSHTTTLNKVKELQSNVYHCLDLLSFQSESIQIALYPYISYQYGTLIYNICRLPQRPERERLISEIKPQKSLLSYSTSLKICTMNFATHIIGFTGMCELMRCYFKIRRTKRGFKWLD